MLEEIFNIREELLHPVLSHFPIALLTLLVFTKPLELIFLRISTETSEHLKVINKFLLYTSPLFLLISIFLGDMAFDIVKKDLCNLTQVYQHEEMGHNALYFLIATISIDIIITYFKKFVIPLHVLLLIGIFSVNYYIFQTAHLGGKLVYEQGAGVLSANIKCK